VPYNLSKVLFIMTANLLDPVPPALLDRMEVIELPGYIEDEKYHIARQFLVPRQIEEHGLTSTHIRFADGALRRVIREYTHEAGVRNLERDIGAVCRKVAKQVAAAMPVEPELELPAPEEAEELSLPVIADRITEPLTSITDKVADGELELLQAEIDALEASQAAEQDAVTDMAPAPVAAPGKRFRTRVIHEKDLEQYLGGPRYSYGTAEEQDEVGVATGVSWTPVGGDTMGVEVSLMEGKGNLLLTGQLGDVMKESAQAALTYARARARQLGIDPARFEKTDIHIHVPAGAIPKDGPSAGVTMATALVSALTGRQTRRDVAMTGEITLRGKVLPIGGLKEKILAAHRAGISTFILPSKNVKDLEEVPQKVRRQMEMVPVADVDAVLAVALRPPLNMSDNKPEPAPETPPVAKPRVQRRQGSVGAGVHPS